MTENYNILYVEVVYHMLFKMFTYGLWQWTSYVCLSLCDCQFDDKLCLNIQQWVLVLSSWFSRENGLSLITTIGLATVAEPPSACEIRKRKHSEVIESADSDVTHKRMKLEQSIDEEEDTAPFHQVPSCRRL